MKYLYKCDKHSTHIFELEFPMGDDNPDIVICPTCYYTAKRYIGTMPAIKYNGTGWVGTEIPRKSGLEDYQS